MPRRRKSRLMAESLFEAETVEEEKDLVDRNALGFLARQRFGVVSAAVFGLVLALVVVIMGSITLVDHRHWHMIGELTLEMHNLDADVGFFYFNQCTGQLGEAPTNGTSLDYDPIVALVVRHATAQFEDYERLYKRARRRLPQLRAIRGRFRRYKREFFAILYYFSIYCSNPDVVVDVSGADIVNAYGTASQKYLVSLDDVHQTHNNYLQVAVIASMCGAFFALAVGLLLWYHATVALKRTKASLCIRNALIEGMGISAIVVDSRKRIVLMNTAACETFGYEEKDVVGKRLHKLLPHPPDLTSCLSDSHNTQSSSSTLQRTLSRLPSFSTHMPSIPVALKRHSHTEAMSATHKLKRHSDTEALGHKPMHWAHHHHHHHHHQKHHHHHHHGKNGDRIEGRSKNGKKLMFSVHVTSFKEVNGEERSILVCQDITELVSKAHELDNQKEVLTEFSQRLQSKYTPTIHILDQIQNLKNSGPEVGKELANMDDDISLCIASLEEADHIIATRLDLFAVFTGTYQTEPNVQCVGLDAIMNYHVEATATRATKGVTIQAEIPIEYRDLPVFGRFDVHLFGHIATNLLSNARRNTTNGDIIFRFLAESSGMLTFAVEDHGKGISAAILDRLFREDDEDDDSNGDKTFGMGLRTCRRFARTIYGDVWLHKTVTEQNGKAQHGTEFRFTLPGRIVVNTEQLKEAHDDGTTEAAVVPAVDTRDPTPTITCSDGAAEDDEKAEKTPTTLTPLSEMPTPAAVITDSPKSHFRQVADHSILVKLRVIIVDDSALIRKSIKIKLTGVCRKVDGEWTYEEHETVESLLATGVENLVKHKVPTLITIDQHLESKGGRLTGTDLIKTLTEAKFPGVMASVSAGPQAVEEHLALGAHFALGKPLPNSDKILEVLHDAFLKVPSQQASRRCSPRSGYTSVSLQPSLSGGGGLRPLSFDTHSAGGGGAGDKL